MYPISNFKSRESNPFWKGKSPVRNHVDQAAQQTFQGQNLEKGSLKYLSSLMSPHASKGNVKAMDKVFNEFFATYPILQPNVITYNIRIKGYIRHDEVDKALEFFQDMIRIGIEPDIFTYSPLIEGLIKSGRLDEALSLYRSMKISPDLKFYSTLIGAVRDAGRVNDYRSLLNDMSRANIKGLPWMYTGLAQCLIEQHWEGEARKVLRLAKELELIPATFDEEKMFPKADNSELDNPRIPGDVTTYNIMIEHYCKENRYDEAMRMFHAMGSMGITPNEETFNILMHFLCSKNQLDQALKLFKVMVKSIKPLPTSYNILLKALFDAGRKEEAFALIKEWQGQLPASTNAKDVTQLAEKAFAYIKERQGQVPTSAQAKDVAQPTEEAFAFIKTSEQAKDVAQPEAKKLFTYSKLNRLLFFHSKNRDIEKINKLCSQFLENHPGENLKPASYHLRIKLHLERGDFNNVDALFVEMRERGLTPSFSCYRHTIETFCQANRVDEALGLTDEMVELEMRPDKEIYFALINVLGLAKRYEEVTGLFFAMKNDGVKPDFKTYNIIREAYVMQQRTDEADAYLHEMEEAGFKAKESLNVQANSGTHLEADHPSEDLKYEKPVERDSDAYIALIESSCNEKNWDRVLHYLVEFEQTSYPKSTRMYNRVLNALSKDRQMDSAMSVFAKMDSPDTVTYNILIMGLCIARKRIEARELFDSMKVDPDELTFKCMIIGYCNAFEFEQALLLVSKMSDYKLVPSESIHSNIINGYVHGKKLGLAKQYYRDNMPTETHSRNSIDLRNGDTLGASFVKLILYLERTDRDSIVTVIIGNNSSKLYNFIASRLEMYGVIQSQGHAGSFLLDTSSRKKY